jgi:hypothetical protein
MTSTAAALWPAVHVSCWHVQYMGLPPTCSAAGCGATLLAGTRSVYMILSVLVVHTRVLTRLCTEYAQLSQLLQACWDHPLWLQTGPACDSSTAPSCSTCLRRLLCHPLWPCVLLLPGSDVAAGAHHRGQQVALGSRPRTHCHVNDLAALLVCTICCGPVAVAASSMSHCVSACALQQVCVHWEGEDGSMRE